VRAVSIPPLTAAAAQIGTDAYVVSLSGELDLHTAPTFEEEVERAFADGGRRVIVDLIGVTFIDSVALGVLTRSAKRLRSLGGECLVVSDDPRIVRVFQITGLDRILRIEHTLAEAVEQLAAANA
jgi:anti-sigma B factor antagonist